MDEDTQIYMSCLNENGCSKENKIASRSLGEEGSLFQIAKAVSWESKEKQRGTHF